jgi:hypothetical protein
MKIQKNTQWICLQTTQTTIWQLAEDNVNFDEMEYLDENENQCIKLHKLWNKNKSSCKKI